MVLRTIISWGWAPMVITAVAIAGYILEWPIEAVAPALGVILIIGLVVAVIEAKEKESERSSVRLRHLAGYFNRRFMGDSSLSIFAIINSLFKTENPKLWDWARACDMAQRVFNSWGNSFIGRLETDTKTGRFGIYLRTYLDELWLLNSLYYEFVEQFSEIAEKVDMPAETTDQYHRFAVEYNAFVENFRGCVSELLKAGKTEIEPPSVKLATEFSGARPLQSSQEGKEKPSPTTQNHKGYYL